MRRIGRHGKRGLLGDGKQREFSQATSSGAERPHGEIRLDGFHVALVRGK